jgi:S1-C subfamily serine protease
MTWLAILPLIMPKFRSAGDPPIPSIQVTTRLLDEGEPVYAFGYPLGQALDLHGSPGIVAPPGAVTGITLSPRVTSAIISSQKDFQLAYSTGAEPLRYAIDRALNFGNSGGPIVAVSNGKAFGVCSAFQQMGVQQPHIYPAHPPVIVMPSLYGIVTSLANPAINLIFKQNSIQIAND